MATLLTRKNLQDDLAFVDDQLRQIQDPYDTARHMWQQRRAAIQHQIDELETEHTSRGEVAILFDGAPVIGSEDIKLQFATKVLDNYQNLVSVFAAEKGGAELKVKGKVPRSQTSKLYIREMLRGSVGFLLEEPASEQNELVATILKEAIDEATVVLRDLSSPNLHEFQSRADSLSPRAIGAIKRIARTLNESGAETRIVGTSDEIALGHERVATMYSRLNEVEVLENRETIEGELQGILPERQQYEFRVGDSNAVVYGPVSEDLDQQYLDNPAQILLKRVRATFLILTTVRGGQTLRQERVLESIKVL
jgi:hypothetical protein